jgi:hypothetical protein
MATVRDLQREVIAGDWHFSENTDPMDDTKLTLAMLSSPPHGDERSTLLVRCRKGRFEIYVSNLRPSYGASTARARFDSEAATTIRISGSQNGNAVFIEDREKRFARALSEHSGKLLLEVPTYNGHTIVPFDLAGANIAVPKVIEACGGWPKQPKQARACTKPWPERCDWELTGEEKAGPGTDEFH